MATPFSEVYDPFLGQITDYDLLELEDNSRDLYLHGLMVSACNKFQEFCLIDLTDRDDTTLDQFNQTLTDEIIDIIVLGMVVEWIKPRYFFQDNLRNSMNTKDYTTFSPANLLKEIRETYLASKKEFENKMYRYSFMNGNFEELKP